MTGDVFLIIRPAAFIPKLPDDEPVVFHGPTDHRTPMHLRGYLNPACLPLLRLPGEEAMMKPATDFGAMIADGQLMDAARRSWHRRKRANRTRNHR